MMHLKLNLHRRMKVMRVGVKTSTSPPISAELWESTTFPQWRIHPSIWQTLVDHKQLQGSIMSLHLADTDASATHGIHQLQWWQSCESQWMIQSTLQHQCQKSSLQKSRPFTFSAPQPVSSHHTHHRLVFHRSKGWWYLLWRTLSNSTIE